MGIDYQLSRTSANMAKAVRQFQKADNSVANEDYDSAINHLSKGLGYFQASMDHLAKADDDAYNKAGNEVDRGNNELQKSLDAYQNENFDSASRHYNNALDHYDNALDLIA